MSNFNSSSWKFVTRYVAKQQQKQNFLSEVNILESKSKTKKLKLKWKISYLFISYKSNCMAMDPWGKLFNVVFIIYNYYLSECVWIFMFANEIQ